MIVETKQYYTRLNKLTEKFLSILLAKSDYLSTSLEGEFSKARLRATLVLEYERQVLIEEHGLRIHQSVCIDIDKDTSFVSAVKKVNVDKETIIVADDKEIPFSRVTIILN